VLVLLVARIEKGLQKLFVSGHSANVLRRGGAFTAHTQGINRFRGRRHLVFQLQYMLPVVAEIVGLLNVVTNREIQVPKANCAIVDQPVLLVDFRIAIGLALNRKLVQ
jgi:hypothetical protein